MIEPRFLLDTNILVYLIAGTSGPLRARIEDREPGEVVTSTLCVAEAAYGFKDSDTQAQLAPILSVVQPMPFDAAAAFRFATVPFRPGRLDRWIGAHALALGLTVVTNNTADFADIPHLRVENWTLPLT